MIAKIAPTARIALSVNILKTAINVLTALFVFCVDNALIVIIVEIITENIIVTILSSVNYKRKRK